MFFMNEQHDLTLPGWPQSFFRAHPSRPGFPGSSPRTFEPGVFILKIAHTFDIGSFHTAELALSGVKRAIADTVLAAHVPGGPPRFDGLQDGNDLMLRKP